MKSDAFATSDNPHVRRLAEAYARWNESRAADTSCWTDLLADGIEIFSLANGRPGVEFTAPCHCPADLERFFAGLRETFEMEFYRIDEMLAEGDRVVAIGRTAWRHRKTGRRIETPKVDIWRFEDGKAVSFVEHYDTAGMIEAAGG